MGRSLGIAFAVCCAVFLVACERRDQEAPNQRAVASLDAREVEGGAETKATLTTDGVVRIGWPRTDVAVRVDGMALQPFAGLGSWAAFKAKDDGAMVMGDTVVFEDEVDAAIDAVFAGGLEITALHNHFLFDKPKVYFMHIAGQGEPRTLAAAVKGVWDAIKKVRASNADPASRFPGPIPEPGDLDAAHIEKIVGQPAKVQGGVVKVSIGRQGKMQGTALGGSMGLGTWAAFSGSDELAAVDGDFIMTAEEVQPVLQALRKAGIHVVALHNHMIGEEPAFYFTHYWGTGPAQDLAKAIRSVLDAQESAPGGSSGVQTQLWDSERDTAGTVPAGWKIETQRRGNMGRNHYTAFGFW